MGAFFSPEIMVDLMTCSAVGVCFGVGLTFVFYMLSTAFDLLHLLVS